MLRYQWMLLFLLAACCMRRYWKAYYQLRPVAYWFQGCMRRMKALITHDQLAAEPVRAAEPPDGWGTEELYEEGRERMEPKRATHVRGGPFGRAWGSLDWDSYYEEEMELRQRLDKLATKTTDGYSFGETDRNHFVSSGDGSLLI